MKKIWTMMVALALAVSGAITPAQAMQLPQGLYYRISYYSDPGMNYLIGQYQISCTWDEAHWGGISEYSYQEYGDC